MTLYKFNFNVLYVLYYIFSCYFSCGHLCWSLAFRCFLLLRFVSPRVKQIQSLNSSIIYCC